MTMQSWTIIAQVLLVTSVYITVSQTTNLKRAARQDGDIILGALFPIHRPPQDKNGYTKICGEIWEQYGIHRVEILLKTLDEINSNPNILPNITLGWDIRDTCWYAPIAMKQSIDFVKNSIASIDETIRKRSNVKECGPKNPNKPIAGLIGPGSSENTIQVQSMLQLFNIPQIGYSATSMVLSNDNLYGYFIRVVPSDKHQTQAIIDVLLSFNWTYVSTMHSDGNYGEKAFEVFRRFALAQGICIATSEAAPGIEDPNTFDKIIQSFLKANNSRVIVCLCEGMTVRRFLQATRRIPEARGYFQILASDGWGDRPDVVDGLEETAAGGISMKLMSKPIPTFDSYFRSLKPENNTRNPWFREYWQWKFECYLDWLPLTEQNLQANTSCTGDEYLDNIVQDAKLDFVVKATYTLAHALHNMQNDVCKGIAGVCPDLLPIAGDKLLSYLMNVSFMYNNETVLFDKHGDPSPRYSIVNFKKLERPRANATYGYRTVGEWRDGRLSLNRNHIVWKSDEATKSICSDECDFGHVKKIHGNIPCCWICTQCKENQIVLDSETCSSCSEGWWPNENFTECEKIPEEYLKWSDTVAMVIIITTSVGLIVTLWVAIVFLGHNDTPVVKSSTKELSYIILFGIFMAFGSNFVLVAKPTAVTCYVIRIIPGISFSLIYGALVIKTNRIARILEGAKRIVIKKPRFLSASAQVIMTGIIAGVECVITTIMLIAEPADCKLDFPTPRRAKLICNTSTFGVIVPLGFDWCLIIMCTLYAVKTRNLPENFNEAKFIGFSMYTTCVIWLAFIAIYFGSEHQILTMAASIFLSALVALALLFFPKIYIIIWAPERNTRSAFKTSKELRCHIGIDSVASSDSDHGSRDIFGPFRRRGSLMARLKGGHHTYPVFNRRRNRTVPPRGARAKFKQKKLFHGHGPITSSSKLQKLSADNAVVNDTPQNHLFDVTENSHAKLDKCTDKVNKAISTKELETGNSDLKAVKKYDFASQTDEDMLMSIFEMPYLKRRNRLRDHRLMYENRDIQV